MTEDQLDWEDEMITRGVHRYRNQQDKAISHDRATDTSAGMRLLHNYVLTVSDHMHDFWHGNLKGRRVSKWAKMAQLVNTDAAAMFTLRHMISTVFKDGLHTVQKLSVGIGGMIEDELRFSKFQTEYKEYYDHIIRQFETGFTKDYRHKHRVLAHLSKEKGMEWHNWTNEERLQVGLCCMRLTMEVVDTFHIRQQNKRAIIVPTDAMIDWIIKHDLVMELASPDRMPTLIQPSPWVDAFEGGYYSPRLRSMTSLIKGTGERNGTRRVSEEANMPKVLTAINGMQDTPWRVNTQVLQIMQRVWELNLPLGMPQSQPYEIPPCPLPAEVNPRDLEDSDPNLKAFKEWKIEARTLHNMETERTAKLRALIRTTRIASEMQVKDIFYYVYQCDFRGRVYSSTTGLSPQGTDPSKAMLCFGRTEPLGVRGMHWLKVHGANKFGYDKTSYQGRVDWIESKHAEWVAVADDPIGMRHSWAGCDKPWQFLAWCLEYKRATDNGTNYRSSLPIALDGSCNGLQHFSAMLRDPIGGRAVNLVPSDVPADIYQTVADVCTRKLKGLSALGEGAATNWLSVFSELKLDGMPRDLSKQPVMTLPYGSTMTACTRSIYQWFQKKARGLLPKDTEFSHAIYLSPILWESISETVIAAREAMTWLQQSSSIITKAGHPLEHTSYLNFPIRQMHPQVTLRRLATQLGGRIDITIGTETHTPNVRKMRQGSAPNLVHSVDAAHLMMCVNAGLDIGIHSFALIHDDFGVHANRIDDWHKIIRKTFVELHTEHDALQDFKTIHEERHGLELPPLPHKGNLDLGGVLDSDYFFS